MADRITKGPISFQCTEQTIFENFESLSLIDTGVTDGFQILLGTNASSEWIQVPTGIPYNIGQSGGKPIDKLIVKATEGKTLNVAASVIY
jgi:hypothetical protein